MACPAFDNIGVFACASALVQSDGLATVNSDVVVPPPPILLSLSFSPATVEAGASTQLSIMATNLVDIEAVFFRQPDGTNGSPDVAQFTQVGNVFTADVTFPANSQGGVWRIAEIRGVNAVNQEYSFLAADLFGGTIACPAFENIGVFACASELVQNDGRVTIDDPDNDGITSDIDDDPVPSSHFSDHIGDEPGDLGQTSGTILTRGDMTVRIEDEPDPDGVRIIVSGSGVPAQIKLDGKASIYTLPAGEYLITDLDFVATITVFQGGPALISLPVGNPPTVVQVDSGEAAQITETYDNGVLVSVEVISLSGLITVGDTSLLPTDPPLVILALGQIEGPPGDPSCTDGVDNDNDGLSDAEDASCQTIAGPTDASAPPAPLTVIAPIDIDNPNTNVLNNENLNDSNNVNVNTQRQSNEQTQTNDNNQTTTVNSSPSVAIDFD